MVIVFVFVVIEDVVEWHVELDLGPQRDRGKQLSLIRHQRRRPQVLARPVNLERGAGAGEHQGAVVDLDANVIAFGASRDRPDRRRGGLLDRHRAGALAHLPPPTNRFREPPGEVVDLHADSVASTLAGTPSDPCYARPHERSGRLAGRRARFDRLAQQRVRRASALAADAGRHRADQRGGPRRKWLPPDRIREPIPPSRSGSSGRAPSNRSTTATSAFAPRRVT